MAGWYPPAGEPTGDWVLNANNENPATKAYLNLYPPEAASVASRGEGADFLSEPMVSQLGGPPTG